MSAPSKTKSIPRALGFAIVIAAISVAGWFFFIKGPPASAHHFYDLAKQVAKDIDKAIHMRPLVTSGGVTIIEASGSIAELSTIEKNFQHTYTWKSKWLGSTKRIELKGDFIAKAGYDISGKELARPFSIDISEDGKTIRAIIPPPRINSIEQKKVEIIKDENGWWNKISTEERQQAMNALLADARKSLEKTDILEEADKSLMTQLETAILKSQPSVEIIREPLP